MFFEVPAAVRPQSIGIVSAGFGISAAVWGAHPRLVVDGEVMLFNNDGHLFLNTPKY